MIQQVLEQYNKSLDTIHKYFDGKFSGSVDDNTHYHWRYASHNALEFDHKPFGDEREANYSEDARLICEKKEYTLFRIHACTGDTYYAVFNNSLKVA